jgi:hypothetical protein
MLLFDYIAPISFLVKKQLVKVRYEQYNVVDEHGNTREEYKSLDEGLKLHLSRPRATIKSKNTADASERNFCGSPIWDYFTRKAVLAVSPAPAVSGKSEPR